MTPKRRRYFVTLDPTSVECDYEVVDAFTALAAAEQFVNGTLTGDDNFVKVYVLDLTGGAPDVFECSFDTVDVLDEEGAPINRWLDWGVYPCGGAV